MEFAVTFAKWKKRFLRAYEAFRRKQQFGVEQQLELLEDLIMAIGAKQSPLEAMENAYSFCTKKNDVAYRDIYLKMNRGATLAVALEGWYDPIIILSIKAGLSNRRLIQALQNAKTTLENQSGVVGKILKANTYAIVLTVTGLVANVAVAKFIIEPMLADRTLESFPALTQFSFEFGMFFYYYWLYLIIGLFVVVGVFKFILNYWVGDNREYFENWIVFRQYRLVVAASFLRSMAVMLKSKETLRKCFGAVKESSKPYLADHAHYMTYSISKKVGIGHVLDSGLLEPQEIARIKTITAVSNDGVDELLLKIAERHERILEKSIASISRNFYLLSILFVALMMLVAFGGQMVAQLANAGMTF